MKMFRHIKKRPACFPNRLALVVTLLLFYTGIMAAAPTPPQDSLQRQMTVVKVIMEKYSEPGSTAVIFSESARFYKVLQTNPRYKEYVSLLKEAQKKRKPVIVRFTAIGSDTIETVSRPASQ